MDCSWGYGLNKACDGGDYDAAMNYLKELGGAIEEDKYEYRGADGFCEDRNVTSDHLTEFQVDYGYRYVQVHALNSTLVLPPVDSDTSFAADSSAALIVSI